MKFKVFLIWWGNILSNMIRIRGKQGLIREDIIGNYLL